MRKVIAFCGFQGCVDEETEFLTRTGWKKIKEYCNREEIAVYNKDKSVSFEAPKRFIEEPAIDCWYSFNGQKVSPEHNVYYFSRSLKHKQAHELYQNAEEGKVVSTFINNARGLELPYWKIRLSSIILAKNKSKVNGEVDICAYNSREANRLEAFLDVLDAPFRLKHECNLLTKYRRYAFNFSDTPHVVPIEWWGMSRHQLSVFLDELKFWLKGKKYITDKKVNADFIQYAYACMGKRAIIEEYKGKWEVTLQKESKEPMEPLVKEPVKERERKYCFTTSTGMWVARRNGKIFVTGNSGKDYSAIRLMRTRGFKKVAYADALREVAFNVLGIPFEEGMKKYNELKVTNLYNGLTFRNILENLGAAIRKYDKDFWARTVVKFIEECPSNVCISDLRYTNEYWVIKDYCEKNNIDFKLIFCDFKSDRYVSDNPHESARFASYLSKLGYKDQEYVDEEDIINYDGGV